MKNKLYPLHPVLIVDDEEHSLLSTDTALRSEGINNTLTCKDSLKVEKLLTQKRFAVIILDMIMPGISGWELCPKIIKKHPDLPVIVLTGTVDTEAAVECMKTGVFDFLTKPVSLSRLTERVRHAIEFSSLKRENRLLKEFLLSDRPENSGNIDLENTSKNQVFELLKKTRQEYKKLFTDIPIPVFVANLKDNTIDHCNTAFAEFMGYREIEEVRKNKVGLIDYLDPESKSSLMEHLKNSDNVENLEITGTKKDGTRFCILLNCKIQREAQYTECSFIDITEHKIADKALSSLEEKYRLLIENADMMILIVQDGFIKYLNSKVLENTEYAMDELLSRPFSEFIHPDDREMVVANYFKRIKGEDVHPRYNFRIKDKNENQKWVELTGVVSRWKEKPATLIFLKDITDMVKTEQELKETETKFKLLFQQSPDAQIIMRKTRFKDCNAAALKTFGCSSREQFLKMGPWHFAPEIQHSGYFLNEGRKLITDALSKDENIKFECKLQRLDREEFPVEITLTPITMHGKKYVYGVVRDLTEQKSLEEQLRQSQKMEALGRLSGGVAHDFNNLLTAIIGYSDLLISKKSLDKRTYSYADEIKKAGHRAASLTQQLLAFSRKQVLQVKEIDLNKLVTNIDKMLKRLIGEDVLLSTQLEPALGRIKADPGQIEQIIMNLAVNARDAMPKGGKLTIETGDVHFNSRMTKYQIPVEPGPYVMLLISDSGTGMDKDTMAHMFDPFFTTKEKDKGTGLGLSTVYGIVDQSSGGVQVQSSPEQGTIFKIYFPRITDPAMKAEKTGQSLMLKRGTETVLLVEDEKSLRELMSTVLESYGYRVLKAENAYEAVKLSGITASIDLMITDIVMPHVSGPELVKDVLKRHSDIKVLYISGYTDDRLGDHGLLDKGVNFLQKPFTPGTLAQKAREVLDQE